MYSAKVQELLHAAACQRAGLKLSQGHCLETCRSTKLSSDADKCPDQRLKTCSTHQMKLRSLICVSPVLKAPIV